MWPCATKLCTVLKESRTSGNDHIASKQDHAPNLWIVWPSTSAQSSQTRTRRSQTEQHIHMASYPTTSDALLGLHNFKNNTNIGHHEAEHSNAPYDVDQSCSADAHNRTVCFSQALLRLCRQRVCDADHGVVTRPSLEPQGEIEKQLVSCPLFLHQQVLHTNRGSQSRRCRTEVWIHWLTEGFFIKILNLSAPRLPTCCKTPK